ncbi:MAG: aspartate ammonia-lyase, partial [bacterium]|nr:aspartate ammonia-lyase [bacterium]
MKPKSRPPKSRIEKDSLGAKKIPADAYYGIQTARAVENFPVSGIGAHPLLVRAYVLIKRAAALTHEELGVLDKAITQPIAAAADEVLAGELADQFVVDVFQAGAGTSFNMNVNEVLANRALEIMGKKRGDYRRISPNDHVNCSQSTNDTFPTAMHLSALLLLDELLPVLHGLAKTFSEKGVEFNGIIKSGRTHLQDAVPVTLGQEFTAYGLTVERGTAALKVARERLEELAIGGSAVGTALNVPEGYRAGVIARLNEMTGLSLRGALDLREAMQCRAAVTGLSATLRTLSLDLIRIANDLRLLSSGPRTGLAEIKLPAVQPGSSIMPGKVNPVMAECLNMVCFQVVGNDLTISMAAQAGQMELNV